MKKHGFKQLFSIFLIFLLVVALWPAAALSAPPVKAPTAGDFDMRAAIAEQTNVLQSEPHLHPDLEGLSGSQQVAVIVHLSKKPVGLEIGASSLKGDRVTTAQVGKIEAAIVSQQKTAKTAMVKTGITYEEGYSYTQVLNGFSAQVKAADLAKLLEIEGVAFVEPDVQMRAVASTEQDQKFSAAFSKSTSFLGVDRLWAEGIEGQGVKVGVLDTGIDADHPEFAGVYKGGRNFVPHSPYYTKARADDDASETKPSDRASDVPTDTGWGMPFATSHGTHVAGTIAAGGANTFGFKGIAPKVELYAYRVLGAYGMGSQSWIIAGVEEAVRQDLDIINLSIASISNSEARAESFALNNAMFAGTLAITAAGNNGLYRGSVTSPGTSRLAVTVGSSTIPEERFSGTVKLGVGNFALNKKLKLMATETDEDPAKQLTGTYEVVGVPNAGEKIDYSKLSVKGKVVVVSAGAIDFHDKVKFAKAAGAKAVLIHNIRGAELAPEPTGFFLGDSFDYIPAFDLSQTDGEAIRQQLLVSKGTVSFSGLSMTKTKGDAIADYSASGPSSPNFDIKPDIIAPGTSIMSAKPMYKADFPQADYSEAYVRQSGTSMATPHITGVAALILQAHPDWQPFDVKVALSNSAKILDTKAYDVFAQGAGRVQAYDAARPQFLAYSHDKAVLNGTGTVVDNIKGTITFGHQPLNKSNISVTKKIIVKDITGKGGALKVTVDTKKTFGNAKVTVDKPSFTLKGEQVLNVTLKASKQQGAVLGDEILGYVHIKGPNYDVSLPFAADFSPVPIAEVQNFSISEDDLSFNNDGINDSAVIKFNLTGPVGKNTIELYDLVNPRSGAFVNGFIGYIHASDTLAAGAYKMPLLGLYRPWNGEPLKKIPDSMYQLHFMSEPLGDDWNYQYDYIVPVIVKTTKPKISGSVLAGKAVGRVIDKYIDYNKELIRFELPYDLNSKLHASYQLNGQGDAVPVTLDQTGAFAFPLPGFTEGTDSITLTVTDEAGNKGTSILK
ncbi:MAG TPA: S8 family serine peptidase [Planococcus sp. (in: firmicutes)]|nr:S8 family serine peptidase [Planococcus sp. (in: firmicutes)]